MKKIAIIILALIVGLCMAHGAFAQEKKYMVILVDVESGEVVNVFETSKDRVNIKDNVKDRVKIKNPEVKIDGNTTKNIEPPFNIRGFTSDKAIGTFYAKSSPG